MPSSDGDGDKTKKSPHPLCPLDLLVAYEEDGRVIPVVSDFDCFLLGTRGVRYDAPLLAHEQAMLRWCVARIEYILAHPQEGRNWTRRWLEVKKMHARRQSFVAQEMPQFGYADPTSYSMMRGAVARLKVNGAVRHGPEAFNYGFPQELDDEYLVISDQFSGVPWKYVDSTELIEILHERIDQGFTFPLNPKWILCDAGWKGVYDRLLASRKPNVQDSMNVWYPQEVREDIARVSSMYPRGFEWQFPPPTAAERRASQAGIQTDLAILELRRFLTRHSGQRNLIANLSAIRDVNALTSVAATGDYSGSNRLVAAMEMNRLAKESHDRFLACLEDERPLLRESLVLMKGLPVPRSALKKEEGGEEGGAESRVSAVIAGINPKEEGGEDLPRRGKSLMANFKQTFMKTVNKKKKPQYGKKSAK